MAIEYDAQYRKTGETPWEYVVNIGPQPWTLSGLEPSTEYETQFRSYDTNTTWTSAWSSSVVVTTEGVGSSSLTVNITSNVVMNYSGTVYNEFIPTPGPITIVPGSSSLSYNGYELEATPVDAVVVNLSLNQIQFSTLSYSVTIDGPDPGTADDYAFTDFRSDPNVPGLPSGWSQALEGGFSVSVGGVASTGERYMRLEKSGVGQDGVKWSELGAHQNIEMFVEWQSVSGVSLANRLKMLLRGDEDTVGSDHLFYGGGMAQASQMRLIKYTPGLTEIGASGTPFASGVRVRMRYRIEGTTHRLKVWEYGQREPRTWFTRTDGSLTAAGVVGLFSYGTSSGVTNTRIYKASVLLLDNNPSLPEAYAEPDVAQYNSPPHPIGYMFRASDDANIWWPDGWVEERDGGARTHRAVDMYDYSSGAPTKGAPIYSVSDGTIAWKNESFSIGVGGGYAIHVDHPSGDARFAYLHMGNDDGGSNPNAAIAQNPRAGRRWAVGDTIYKHELLGWLGDSGVTGSGAHLHFEYRSRIVGQPSDDRWSNGSATPGTADFLRWSPVTALWEARIRNDYPN